MYVEGTSMTVGEFEAKLELMYGLNEININPTYMIDGWRSANWTVGLAYLIGMIFGLGTFITMALLIVLNERKYMKLDNVWNLMYENLRETKDGQTSKLYNNRLIFTKGDLSFEKRSQQFLTAKDDLLGFSSDGMLLHRNVEIYQWIRKPHPFRDDEKIAAPRFRYERIWAQDHIDSSDYPPEY
jgi:hypothetical protein